MAKYLLGRGMLPTTFDGVVYMDRSDKQMVESMHFELASHHVPLLYACH